MSQFGRETAREVAPPVKSGAIKLAIAPRELRSPAFVEMLLGAGRNSTLPPEWFRQLNLAMIAFTGLIAAALSLFILFRSELTAATRRLAAALALGPLSAGYFFFLATHPPYRQALRLDTTGGMLATSFLCYAAGLVACCMLARFFLDYPRRPVDQELDVVAGSDRQTPRRGGHVVDAAQSPLRSLWHSCPPASTGMRSCRR